MVVKRAFQSPTPEFGSALGSTAEDYFGRLSERRGIAPKPPQNPTTRMGHGIQFAQRNPRFGSDGDVNGSILNLKKNKRPEPRAARV